MTRSGKSRDNNSQVASGSTPTSTPQLQTGNNAPVTSTTTSTPQRQPAWNPSAPGVNLNSPSSITVSPSTGTGTVNQPFIPAKYDPPELDEHGKNHDLWSKALTLGLRNRGLWHVVNGTEHAPDETIDVTAYDNWFLKDQEAQLMLLKALKEPGQKCIYRAQTSKESWDLLKARYSGGSDLRKASLLEKVFCTSLFDTEPLQPQVDAIIYAAHQLESVGETITDSILGYLLVHRLPSSYSTLRTVLISSESPKFSSKWVADQIIAEEHHRISESSGSATTFFANAKTKSGESRANNNNKKCSCCNRRGHDVSECYEKNDTGPKCSYCEKRGHEASDCRKKKRNEEKDKANTSNASTSTPSVGSSGATTAKANLAIVDDDTVRLYYFNGSLSPFWLHQAQIQDDPLISEATIIPPPTPTTASPTSSPMTRNTPPPTSIEHQIAANNAATSTSSTVEDTPNVTTDTTSQTPPGATVTTIQDEHSTLTHDDTPTLRTTHGPDDAYHAHNARNIAHGPTKAYHAYNARDIADGHWHSKTDFDVKRHNHTLTSTAPHQYIPTPIQAQVSPTSLQRSNAEPIGFVMERN